MSLEERQQSAITSIVGTKNIQTAAQEAIDDLLKQLKYTAASRFNAAKRLEANERRLTTLISIVSAGIVGVTLLPYFFRLSEGTVSGLNLSAVVLSIIILAFSLLQRSADASVKAEQHHRSGLEINEIRRELLAKRNIMSVDELAEFSKRYSSVLQKYSVNHDDIDYLKAQVERPEENPWIGPLRRAYIRFQISLRPHLLYIIVIGVVMLLAITIFSPSISYRLLPPS
jgi:hypothetical protein